LIDYIANVNTLITISFTQF